MTSTRWPQRRWWWSRSSLSSPPIRVTQIVVHALQRGRSARAILERRLAKGQIDAEEFFELESALRSSEPKARPPRRLLRL